MLNLAMASDTATSAAADSVVARVIKVESAGFDGGNYARISIND